MNDNFNIEIISPERTLLTKEINSAVIPSFEGEMTILSNHIPLITFLRPGILKISGTDKIRYFLEEGTVEFSNNKLLILSSTVKDLNTFDKNLIYDLLKEAEIKFKDNNSSDKEKYIISYKINTLRKISQ